MYENLLMEMEILKNTLMARATGGNSSDTEYKELRRSIMSNPQLKSRVPRFVQTCRSLDEFWGYI